MRSSPLTTDRFRWTQRVNVVLLVLNTIGAVIYLHRASYGWRIPQEQKMGLDSITAEPYIWFAAVLPILAVFLLLNLIWGALILRYREWRSGRLWLLTELMWVAAIATDFMHH